jgi:antitoxin (DNA-binding transcriptional repressor) of toxin-antitoxin stability system
MARRRVIRVSEAEATTDFASVLARVRAGAEVVIEHDATPVALVRPPSPDHRLIGDCIALLSAGSTATVDVDFARDVEAAIASHPESLNPPGWE